MKNLYSAKIYALTSGGLLFGLGLLGFAFRPNFDLPVPYLLMGLVVGFWGIVVGVGGE